jgi:putative transposase
MKNVTSKPALSHSAIETNSHLFDDWFDPIEDMIRGQVRGLIEEMVRGELDATLSRPRYGRRGEQPEGRDSAPVVTGHRHGSRVRTLTGTFGKTEIAVPRARLNGSGGKTTEWKSQVLRNYQRRTRAADALIAGAYLAGTNTRRVRRALRSVFGGEVGKDTVSRVWRKVKGDTLGIPARWPTSRSCG